jgi:kynurenine formamidase
MTPDHRLNVSVEALQRVKAGRTYDLSSGWWHQMPLSPFHPPFQVLTYRSPSGIRNEGDIPFLVENPNNIGLVTELVMGTAHTGTHIDAVAHVTAGDGSCWHGGHSADTELSDFGPLTGDAPQIPVIIGNGVLLDVAGALGVDHLAPAQGIGAADLDRAARQQAVDPSRCDVILVRTGAMGFWPEVEAITRSAGGAGVDLDGGKWLADFSPIAVGGDTSAFEKQPSGLSGDPLPVHRLLLQEQGIHIIEWLNLEELARQRVHSFLFVCVPLPIRGATASMVRPLAIV